MLQTREGKVLWPLLSVLLLAASSRAQPPACLQTTGLACVECGPTIFVDSASGENCGRSLQTARSLANRTCSSLEDVLLNIAAGFTTQGGRHDCIEIAISLGEYPVNEIVGTISQSVVMRGVVSGEGGEDVRRRRRQARPRPPRPRPRDNQPMSDDNCPQEMPRVTFDPTVEPVLAADGSQVALYLLQFSSASLVGVAGVEFEGTSGLIGLDNVTAVHVENSSFSRFSQSALDVYNCDQVFVSGSCFHDNGPAFLTKPQNDSAQAAGLSITYASDIAASPSHPLIARVIGSFFADNFATTNLSSIQNTNTFNVLRGAGLSLRIYSNEPVSFLMEDCEFLRNEVTLSGGAVFIALEDSAEHRVIVNGTRFERNSASELGGALAIILNTGTLPLITFTEVLVTESTFQHNNAGFGGAAYVLPVYLTFSDFAGALGSSVYQHQVTFDLCTFHRNTAREVGGAIATSFLRLFDQREAILPLNIADCVFTENEATNGGVLTTSFHPLRLRGANHFCDNRGASLVVDGARVVVSGLLNFTDNTNIGVLGGGVLYFVSMGQIELTPNTHVVFSNNKGVVGSGVAMNTLRVPRIFSQLFGNPLCSFIFSDPTVSPLDWADYNVTLTFTENRAVVAAAVAVDNFDLCSWSKQTPPYFERQNTFLWPRTVELNGNVNDAHANTTLPRWAVQSGAVRLEVQPQVSGFPGEMIDAMIFAFDELDQPVPSEFLLTDNSQTSFLNASEEIEYFKFTPATVTVQRVSQQNRTPVMFSTLGAIPSEQVETIQVETLLTNSRTKASFGVISRQCPPGRRLEPISQESAYSTCQCNFEHRSVINCQRRATILEDHLWGTIDRDMMGDPLVTYPCPGGYCRCFVTSVTGPQTCAFVFDDMIPNQQCDCDREGILCGGCVNGTGFSALLNKCVTCDDTYGLIILALIIFHIVFVLLLFTLLLSYALPSWAYPCIFYLQILPRFVEHFPVTFEKFGVYMSYISSALELYFPYDFCLGSEMTALAVYSLRFIPGLVAIAMAPGLLFLRLYVAKRRPVPWHASWNLLLLLFTPLLHTSVSILNCPSLPRGIMNDFENKPRWYIDGNIQCFTGGHIPMALLAIVVLFVCVFISIPGVVLFALGILKRPRWLHHYIVPLTHAYKERYKWWSAVELFQRVLIVVSVVAFPNNNYPSMAILAVILTVYGLLRPYKNTWSNILDVLLGSEILILLFMRNTSGFEDDFQNIPPQPRSLTLTRNGRVQCGKIEGHTGFAAMLAAFYYVPLLVSLVALLVGAAFAVRDAIKNKGMPMYQNYMARKKQPSVHKIVPKGESLKRARTQTVVQLCDLDTPPPTPQQLSNRTKETTFTTDFHRENDSGEIRTTVDVEDERLRQPTITEVSVRELEALDRVESAKPKLASRFKLSPRKKKVGKIMSLPVEGNHPCCPKESRGKLLHSKSDEGPQTSLTEQSRDDSIAAVKCLDDVIEEGSQLSREGDSGRKTEDTTLHSNDSSSTLV